MANALAAPARIELQEYGAPVVCKAKDIDLHALAKANKHWKGALGLSSDPIRVVDCGEGFVEMRAEAVTGVVRVGQTDIEIAPKFLSATDAGWQTVLWRILAVVDGGHVDENLATANESASLSITDLLAEMFLASYASGAARGLPRGYITEEASGPVLRGSLDLSRISEWVARPWEVPYAASLLTDDTPLARLFRWTAECLSGTVKTPARVRALRDIASSLSHIGMRPPSLREAQRIALGAQHQGLESARIVGLLLLEGVGVHHAQGVHALSGFLWNSDVIYENYVFWLCIRAASRRGVRVSREVIRFGDVISGHGSRLVTAPDVIFRDNQGVVIAVTDAKYKRFGSRPKAPDTYQVLTAGHVLGCQRISLTYPVAQYRKPAVWRVSSALGSSDIELTALPLNLMSLTHPNGEHALIETIYRWLDGNLFAGAVANAA